MTRATAQQLSLPCSLAEATTLQQQLTIAHRQLNDLYEELVQTQDDRDMWRSAFREQEGASNAAQATIRLLTSQLETARAHASIFQNQLRTSEILRELQGDRYQTTPGARPSWLDHALRDLIVLAHPDKWSQGQAATELGHQVLLELNTLRARLGEGT